MILMMHDQNRYFWSHYARPLLINPRVFQMVRIVIVLIQADAE